MQLSWIYYQSEQAKKRERMLKQAFDQYLSPIVINDLLTYPEKMTLGGERKDITAFFSDIANFTTISESLDPQALVELLNESLGAMTEIIIEEGGIIDKYIGAPNQAAIACKNYSTNGSPSTDSKSACVGHMTQASTTPSRSSRVSPMSVRRTSKRPSTSSPATGA